MTSTILINNKEYTQVEINNNEELQKELMKQLKKEYYRVKGREAIREWRKNNKELALQRSRDYQRTQYNEDENYKMKKREYMKKYRESHYVDSVLLPENIKIRPIGRPSKFKLPESLELLVS